MGRIKKLIVSILSFQTAKGLLRDLNPGPPPPEEGIIPLDQGATMRVLVIFSIKTNQIIIILHFFI